MRKPDFREPLTYDSQGLFITIAQMQFYLNRPRGKEKFKNGDQDFLKYYKNCKLYNLIYEMMVENEDCASMYWDHKSGTVAITFPVNGQVAKQLSNYTFTDPEAEDDDDDEYYIF
tara:strand:+ start:287 stop:631 length:345 start_codon:yes stop_codon:yes gene_type:complete